MQALSRYPDQREYLCADLPNRIGPAVEELVRWATPVQTFRRTATRDTQLRDQIIRAGEKVVMFYGSANRDDRVFEEPRRFNVARSPNPHLGFGGGGTHFCLGASLARTQLRALFEQLLSRVHGLEVGEPHRLVSNFVNNVHSMPYHY